MLSKQKNIAKRVLSHVKTNNVKHALDIAIVNNSFQLNDEQAEFYTDVFESSEFKQQLQTHAVALFELLDYVTSDYELAHSENVYDQAQIMNDNFCKAETDKQKKKAVK